MLKQLHEKEKSELKPEQKLKEKKEEPILKAVAGISADGVIQETHKLKQDIGGMLNKLTDRLAAEVNKFDQVQLAIEIKERELKEVYDIEKAAATLAALIESQRQEKLRFEEEMAQKQASLEQEIESTKLQWQKEKADHQASTKEQQEQEAKDRKRQKEEYQYTFEREQQLARDKFEDEKAKLQVEKQALELQMKNLKEQNEQIAKLSIQQDTAYQKIQDVAVKAIEGASKASSFSDLQHVLSEQVKKKQTNDH